MARSRSKIAAVPTALVAAAGGRKSGRRRTHLALPGPFGSRRRQRKTVMRVAKNAAAVVSAVTVVLDVASQVSSLKESMADRSEEKPTNSPRKSTPAKKRPAAGARTRQSNGASRGSAKAHASSSANGSTARRKD
jgi:hypothetical protein